MALDSIAVKTVAEAKQALRRNDPIEAFGSLNAIINQIFGWPTPGFQYNDVARMRDNAYNLLQIRVNMQARTAWDQGREQDALDLQTELLALVEMRNGEAALLVGNSGKAVGCFYLAEALAESVGLNANCQYKKLEDFYYWATLL